MCPTCLCADQVATCWHGMLELQSQSMPVVSSSVYQSCVHSALLPTALYLCWQPQDVTTRMDAQQAECTAQQTENDTLRAKLTTAIQQFEQYEALVGHHPLHAALENLDVCLCMQCQFFVNLLLCPNSM
jgi:hypothetical protein